MYQLLESIFVWFNTDISYTLGGILYVLFWAAVLALSLSFVSSWDFVHRMNDVFPRLSVFLASIGWIPYFSVLYVLVSLYADYITNGSDSLTVYLNNYMPVYDVYMGAIVLSLLYATYKVFYKGEDLDMSCAI
jgi:predicted PurR-regulated permease PerM